MRALIKMSKMGKMPKIAFCAAFLTFLIGSAAFPQTENVVGTFESLAETNGGFVITLIVNGQRASGPVSASCKYYDHDGKEVSRHIFGAALLGEPITVEVLDRSGEVYACRAVRFFYTN